VVDTKVPALSAPAGAETRCDDCPGGCCFGTATATDACDGDVDPTSEEDVFDRRDGCSEGSPVGTYTRTWTATDACGNTATGAQTVNVVDDTPPTLTVPPAAEKTCAECPGVNCFETATATDSCGGPPVSLTMPVPDVFDRRDGCSEGSPVGIYTRDWTATDACGNTAKGSQTVTLVDNTPPMIVGCPARGVSVDLCGDVAPLTKAGPLTMTDDCPLVISAEVVPRCCWDGTVKGAVRTWAATDACGNEAIACTQNVLISTDECVIVEHEVAPEARSGAGPEGGW